MDMDDVDRHSWDRVTLLEIRGESPGRTEALNGRQSSGRGVRARRARAVAVSARDVGPKRRHTSTRHREDRAEVVLTARRLAGCPIPAGGSAGGRRGRYPRDGGGFTMPYTTVAVTAVRTDAT